MRNVLLLAWLPTGLAAFGAWLDESRALGFTIWRSVCRASGISLPSIATFTLELIPTAVIGALAGGLLVLVTGACDRPERARDALAAHAGCGLVMPLGLLLCASAWPWPLTLAAEAGLAVLAAVGVTQLSRIRNATYADRSSRGVSRIPPKALPAENFSVTHPWNSHDSH